MKVWDLMTRIDEDEAKQRSFNDEIGDDEFIDSGTSMRLKKFSDHHLSFEEICMPEIEVTCYYGDEETMIGEVQTTMKLRRVMEYQHLSTDIEEDYPQNQEYFLYSDDKV